MAPFCKFTYFLYFHYQFNHLSSPCLYSFPFRYICISIDFYLFYISFLYKTSQNLCWGEPLNFRFLIYCSNQDLRIFRIKFLGKIRNRYKIHYRLPKNKFKVGSGRKKYIGLSRELHISLTKFLILVFHYADTLGKLWTSKNCKHCTNPTHLANIRLKNNYGILFLNYWHKFILVQTLQNSHVNDPRCLNKMLSNVRNCQSNSKQFCHLS